MVTKRKIKRIFLFILFVIIYFYRTFVEQKVVRDTFTTQKVYIRIYKPAGLHTGI